MQIAKKFSVELLVIPLILGFFAAFAIPVLAQDSQPVTIGNVQITGFPEDWTHHRLVFSNPGTEEDAIRKGNFERWHRVVNDPRYVFHQLRRQLPVHGPAADAVATKRMLDAKAALEEPLRLGPPRFPVPPRVPSPPKKNSIKKDWNETLGAVGSPGYSVFPVKWTYNFSAASCANDFVAYPTGQAGSATQASIIAYYNLYSGCGGTVPGVDWAYNTGGTIALSPVASIDGTQLAFIQTATSGSGTGTVTFTANPTAGTSQITIGGVQYLFESSTTATGCTTTTAPPYCVLVGSTAAASAQNLAAAVMATASACSTQNCFSASAVANAGASATYNSSVVTITNKTGAAINFTVGNQGGGTLPYTLNPNGGNIPGGVASLVILRIPLIPPGSGTLTSPVSPANLSTASYAGCTAPCMTSIPLSGNPTDTASSPFYDYSDDELYVGDSVGKIHRFHPVFNGTPAEVTGSWPVQLARGATNDTNQAGSPVYDPGTGYLLVGSTGTATYGQYCSGCGYLYSIGTGYNGTASGSIHGYSGQLDAVWGIRDAPLVDSSAGKAYIFAGNDGTVGTGYGNNNVNQFATNFTTGSGTKAALPCPATYCKSPYGTGGTSNGNTIFQLSGTFDNTYYSGATPTGNLYVAGTGDGGYLYQIPITNNVMGTPVVGPSLTYGSWYYGRFSPITEFYNTGQPIPSTGTVTIASSTTNSSDTITIGGITYTWVTSVTAAPANAVLETERGNTGTATFNSNPTANNQVQVGGTTYYFQTSAANCGHHTNQPCILIGTNVTQNAANLEAAINAQASQCGYPAGGPCFYYLTASSGDNSTTGANLDATATVAGAVVTVTNTTSGTITLSSNNAHITASGNITPTYSQSAQNLAAAINANSSQCAVSPCYSSGTVANANASATYSGNVVTVTNLIYSPITFTASNTTDDALSPNTGTINASLPGTDYIFLSVFAGTQSGCNYGATQNVAPFYGCVMAFNVTTPSSFSSTMSASGTLNVSSTEYNAPTGGIIIDNSATTPVGASQIYFETNEPTGTSPCTGVCAVQASQSALQ